MSSTNQVLLMNHLITANTRRADKAASLQSILRSTHCHVSQIDSMFVFYILVIG